MKRMRFKMVYNVVTIIILFESTLQWFLCFHNGPHVENQLTALMHLRIQLYPYEYWPQVNFMDPLSQGPSVHRSQ